MSQEALKLDKSRKNAFCSCKANNKGFYFGWKTGGKRIFPHCSGSQSGVRTSFLPCSQQTTKCWTTRLKQQKVLLLRYHSMWPGCHLFLCFSYIIQTSERKQSDADDSRTTSWEVSSSSKSPAPSPRHRFALLTQIMVIMDVFHINGGIKQ